jgi:hypothetical protein
LHFLGETLLEPFSLIVAGPILSRLKINGIQVSDIEKSFKLIKKMNELNEIILSTYDGEVPNVLINLVDKILYNYDVGADPYKFSSWPIGSKFRRSHSNNSRLFSSSLNGFVAAGNRITIKTRIELIPEDENFFYKWYEEISYQIQDGKIAFFTESYSGIQFSVDGTLLKLPDILLVSTKETAITLWEDSLNFWNENKKLFTRKIIRYPIGSDQILGYIFLSKFYEVNLDKIKKRLRLHYIPIKLLSKIVLAENNSFIWSEYKNSGFTKNYFTGLSHLKVPPDFINCNLIELWQKIAILYFKNKKHHLRRFLLGIKMQLSIWR